MNTYKGIQTQKLLQHAVRSVVLSIVVFSAPLVSSQVIITNNYTQNFNNLESGLPNGWGTYTQISSSSLGTALNFTNSNPSLAINSWSNTTGAFKNLASSTGLTQTSSVSAQQESLDRALGIRPTGTFGDAATNFASINFNFSTLGYQITNISLDAMVLATEGRVKLWDIQYGIGSNPNSWTTLATFTSGSDWYTQSYSFTTSDFGSNLDNQESIWFRFSSTSLSTGSGSRPTVAIDNFSLEVVPEPSTIALLSLSIAILSIVLVRKKTKGYLEQLNK